MGRDVPSDRWFAMTRLDENRAKTQLALKAGFALAAREQRRHLGQSFQHALSGFLQRADRRKTCDRRDSPTASGSRPTLSKPCNSAARRSSRRAAFLRQNRRRTARSNPCRSIVNATPGDDWHSVALCSDGSYGIEKGLICSFPTRSDGARISIVQDVPLNDFAKSKVEATVNELKEERAMVAELLPQ